MSIKENLIKETYDLDVIEMDNGIVDKDISFDIIKTFLNNFFMKEGYLVVRDDKRTKAKAYFKVSDKDISLTIYTVKNLFIYEKLNLNTFETEVELGELTNLKVSSFEEIFEIKDGAVQYADAVLSHLCYANYLAHTQREVVVENTITERKTLSSKKKDKKKKKSKTIRRIKLTNEVRRVYAHKSDGEKRTYERHTESWTVRGHYRHYKSGKVVWIPASTRGSGKVQNKVYTIGG